MNQGHQGRPPATPPEISPGTAARTPLGTAHDGVAGATPPEAPPAALPDATPAAALPDATPPEEPPRYWAWTDRWDPGQWETPDNPTPLQRALAWVALVIVLLMTVYVPLKVLKFF